MALSTTKFFKIPNNSHRSSWSWKIIDLAERTIQHLSKEDYDTYFDATYVDGVGNLLMVEAPDKFKLKNINMIYISLGKIIFKLI